MVFPNAASNLVVDYFTAIYSSTDDNTPLTDTEVMLTKKSFLRT